MIIELVLQNWTKWQRKLFYQGRLSLDHIDRLNKIRFSWEVQEGYWQKMYEALFDFKHKFGHAPVPYQWGLNPQLSASVYRMRVKKQELSPQQVALLDQIGLGWFLSRGSVASREAMYNRLLEFRKERHHTCVPVKWPDSPNPGKWVSRMRHEREKLDPERVSFLEKINFEWSSRTLHQTG